jgi:integrase
VGQDGRASEGEREETNERNEERREVMAIFKRGNVWWYEFIFAGRRMRESAKTSRKTLAVEAEKSRRLELERAYVGLPAEEAVRRVHAIADIVKAYRNAYPVSHRPKSVDWVNERTAHVERVLGKILLPNLTEDRIREYMKVRIEEGAGNRTINMELSCLSRAIGRTWRELWPKIKKLEEPSDVGRALASGEERSVLQAACKNKSRLIHAFIRVALLTAMRYNEIRTLRWCQVDFDNRAITVGKAKSRAGKGRVIPMNGDLFETISMYACWYRQEFSEARSEWYVFPFSNRVKPIDPTRPVTTIKTAWETVRSVANVECRFHDLRHTTLTKMAEAGVPESTMLALAGHMSRAMLERYSHIRMKAKRAAVETISLESSATPSIGVPTISPTVEAQSKPVRLV